MESIPRDSDVLEFELGFVVRHFVIGRGDDAVAQAHRAQPAVEPWQPGEQARALRGFDEITQHRVAVKVRQRQRVAVQQPGYHSIAKAEIRSPRAELRIATDAAARAGGRTLSLSQSMPDAIDEAKAAARRNVVAGQHLQLVKVLLELEKQRTRCKQPESEEKDNGIWSRFLSWKN